MKSFTRLSFAVIAIAVTSIAPALAEQEIGGREITGAGSTFAFPIVAEWAKAYDRARFESEYDVGGSGLDSAPVGQTLTYEPVVLKPACCGSLATR